MSSSNENDDESAPFVKIESRTCSAYDIPIESRTCSAYDIPINSIKKNENAKTSNDNDDAGSSSVVDKEEIASRGIVSSKDGVMTRDQVHDEIQSFLKMPFQWRNEVRSFLTIIMFLTRVPVPASIDLHPGFLMRGMCFFPVIAMVIGIAVATCFDAVEATGLPPIIAATVSVGVGWIITGCFHEDGLSDSADGIGGGWTRAQIFKIMTDSRVGTYGCAVLGLYTITKVQLLASLGGSDWKFAGGSLSKGAGPATMIAHTVARVTAPYLIRCFDYVDDEQGPKSSFYAFMIQAKHLVNWPRAIFAIAFGGLVVALLYNPMVALLLMVVTLAFAHAAGRYGSSILGGVMGDFLGATICLSELLVLAMLLLVQQWDGLSWINLSAFDIQTLHSMVPQTMDEIIHNRKGAALVRFLIMVGCRKAWTMFVDYTNGPSPESVGNGAQSSSGTTVSDTSNSSTDKGSDTECSDSPKATASRILALPTSTFQERFDAALAYLDVLAKPVGSLGTLEVWAARLAALQRTLQPDVSNVACLIFAADHGAAAAPAQGGEGCSAYPQAVTRSILLGLHRGVAGASVLANANNVSLRVVDVGVMLGDDDPFQGSNYVYSSPQKLPTGTRNFCLESAMSAEECERCMSIGRESLRQCVEETSTNAVVLGEVGIGNTTSSSCLIAALTGKSTKELCGGGAFASRDIAETVVSRKVAIVDRALDKHFGKKQTSIQAADALAKLGGGEIASLVGALLECSSRDLPVLVDGFIATAAALVAVSISPSVCRVLFFTSHSVEPGQRAAIEKIQAIAREHYFSVDECPVLSMSLRMGEATAALLAVPILRSSAKVICDMATIKDIMS